MDEFLKMPEIPKDVWDYLAWIQRMENQLMRAQLQILSYQPRHTHRQERMARMIADKILTEPNCKFDVASSDPDEAHVLMKRVAEILRERQVG